MKARNGPVLVYEVVYRWFPKRVYSLKKDGFFSFDYYRKGILIKSTGRGGVMYLHPEDYLSWKHGKEVKDNE